MVLGSDKGVIFSREHISDLRVGLCTCRITMEGNDRTSEFSCTDVQLSRLYIFIFTNSSCLTLYQFALCIVPLNKETGLS
jgi:hypothetical protein